jgi:hypothetical protein
MICYSLQQESQNDVIYTCHGHEIRDSDGLFDLMLNKSK